MIIIIIYLYDCCSCFFFKACTFFGHFFFTFLFSRKYCSGKLLCSQWWTSAWNCRNQRTQHLCKPQVPGSRRFWVLFQCYFYNLGEFYLQGHAPPATGRSFHQRCLRCVRRTMGIGHWESRKSVNHGHWLLRFSAWHVMWVCQRIGAILKIGPSIDPDFSAWHKLCFLGIPVFPSFLRQKPHVIPQRPPIPTKHPAVPHGRPLTLPCIAPRHLLVLNGEKVAPHGHPHSCPWQCTRSRSPVLKVLFFFEFPKIVFFCRCLKMFWKFPHFSAKSSYLGAHETALQVGQITIYHHILSI